MSKDYYKILGVEKNASDADIKSAFRKLAHQYHPDKNGGDDKKFKEVNEAYQTLSDKNKRAQYDQFGSAGANGFGGGQGNPFGNGFGGFSWEDIMRQAQQGGFQQGNVHFDMNDFDLGDLFGAAFGFGGRRVRKGRNVEVQISMTFKESVRGFTKDIEVPNYQDGAQKGMKKVSVTIPGGVEDGQQLRMDGAGETVTDGRPGNLFILVRVQKHPTIYKDGNNLVTDLSVSLRDALLGRKITIETLDGTETIEIPECMPVGHVIKLKGKGVSQGFMRAGDFIVVTHIKIPKKLSKDAKKHIEDIAKELDVWK